MLSGMFAVTWVAIKNIAGKNIKNKKIILLCHKNTIKKLFISPTLRLVNFHSKCKMVRRSFGVLQQSIPVPSSSRGPFPAGCLYGIFPS